jgi:hypothetical protein
MVTREKSIDEISVEWQEVMARHTSKELDMPVLNATRLLESRIKGLGRIAGQTEKYMQVPNPIGFEIRLGKAGHYHLTREQIDLEVVEELKRYVEKYGEGIKEAVGSMRMTAEAQSYSPQEFDGMLRAMSQDSKEHTSYIKELLEQSRDEFRGAKTYKELLGSAAMLRGELVLMAYSISRHLEGVARAEKAKTELRT